MSVSGRSGTPARATRSAVALRAATPAGIARERSRRAASGTSASTSRPPRPSPPRRRRQPRCASRAGASTSSADDYLLVAGFPLRPAFRRETVRTEVVKGRIWTFEQPHGLGFSRITVNIRMTVVKLRDGTLLVYCPIAPTRSCLSLLSDLGAEVSVIVLPSFAIEHKAFCGPFSRRFPGAAVRVGPGCSWTFPLDLPLPLIGIFNARELGGEGEDDAWPADEFDFAPFVARFSDLGPYAELALYHRDTRTPLVTDCVCYVPEEPPAGVPMEDVLANSATGEDTRASRRVGWARIVMQVLFFGPRDLSLRGWETESAPAGFAEVKERLIVSPVVRELVFREVPEDVRAWVSTLCSFDFVRIIPAHLASPVRAGPSTLREAFAFAFEDAELPLATRLQRAVRGGGGGEEEANPDLGALNSLNSILRLIGAKKRKAPDV